MVFALPAVVLLGLGVRSEPAPGFREDEVQCEEAKAHVETCCGGDYGSNLSCVYVDNGSCEQPTEPDLGADEGRVVEHLSCSDVVTLGYCTHTYDHSPPSDDY